MKILRFPKFFCLISWLVDSSCAVNRASELYSSLCVSHGKQICNKCPKIISRGITRRLNRSEELFIKACPSLVTLCCAQSRFINTRFWAQHSVKKTWQNKFKTKTKRRFFFEKDKDDRCPWKTLRITVVFTSFASRFSCVSKLPLSKKSLFVCFRRSFSLKPGTQLPFEKVKILESF